MEEKYLHPITVYGNFLSCWFVFRGWTAERFYQKPLWDNLCPYQTETNKRSCMSRVPETFHIHDQNTSSRKVEISVWVTGHRTKGEFAQNLCAVNALRRSGQLRTRLLKTSRPSPLHLALEVTESVTAGNDQGSAQCTGNAASLTERTGLRPHADQAKRGAKQNHECFMRRKCKKTPP